MERRAFLAALSALGLGAATHRAPVLARPRLPRDPFMLGVASGYPSPGGMVLWTRLLLDPEAPDGGLGAAAVPVRWEVAADESMRKIVASGSTEATPEWGHSVHVQAKGLEPDRWYWYRFMAGDATSAPARTRTSPAHDARVDRLRFAFASCQQYEQGFFGAHRHIAEDAPDLVAFLGDYIYESSWGRNHVRRHETAEPYTLPEYRARYARYKSDADLQRAHAACPWIVTWDDHEVDNDYANDRPEDGMDRARFLARRAAAYRAFYEHMPLPERMRPDGAGLRLHTRLGWGQLARFFILDNRQYRSWQACPRKAGGGNVVDPAVCTELDDPKRTMLGTAQERWLDRAFAESRAGWNLVTQQTLMAQLDSHPGEGRRVWTDGWSGYPAARRRLLESALAHRLANPVVIGGDVHHHAVADLKLDFDDPHAAVVASEICGTSITSQSRAQKALDAAREENPHLKLMDGRHRGYVRVEVRPQGLTAELRAMAGVQSAQAACSTLAAFTVENGRAGAQRTG